MHPTWEQLVDYGDKRLTPEEAEQVSIHLATCATCDAEVEWLDRTTNTLRTVSFTAPPRALRLAAEDLFAQRLGGPSPAVVVPPPITPAPRGRLLRVNPAVWQRARWVGAAIAALLVLAFFVQQRQSAPLIAAVQDVQGDVQVQRNAGTIQPLTTADTVREGDLLTTATNGTAQVSFAEGAVRVTMLGDSHLLYEDDNSADASRASLRLATNTSGDLEITVTGPPAVELATPVMVLRMEQGTFRTHYLTPRTIAVRVVAGTLTATTQDGASYTFTAGDDHIWQRDPQSGNIVPVPITDATPTPTATATPLPSPTVQATATVATATLPPSVTATTPATATTQATATSPASATAIRPVAPPVAPSPSRVPALVPSATPTLPLILIPPTDDNSGSGSGDDDNSGSGSGNDDDNSGSGSGGDDNSGSGSGDDDNSGSGSGNDDNSGSGSGGDDNSGSGSGGDDNSGSGSGGDDNSGSGSSDE